jgi:molybdopterin/thiamine biosynthesis adenylyltransferase
MTRLSDASDPELRDGVEIFLYPQKGEIRQVLFLFLSNRRRLRIDCKPAFAVLLKEFARTQSLSDSLEHAGLDLDDDVKGFLLFLTNEGIITMTNPLETALLPSAYVEQYKRQIYFLIDVLKSPQQALESQKKIFDSHITIFGLGAVGSQILQQLCMMGFRQFTLVDYATVETNDIARTLYKVSSCIGLPKTEAARTVAEDLAFEPKIQVHDTTLMTQTDLDRLVQGTSLIVNTADEPYIGYTNIKLSRYALEKNIPLIAGGGFDAHLASLGELLVPHVTPCADCYATFFDESLKEWKPIPHPVKDREGWFGGLGSLSVFSASTGVLEILSYFIEYGEKEVIVGGRGEFMFHDYSLDTFTVEMDESCESCGGGRVK